MKSKTFFVIFLLLLAGRSVVGQNSLVIEGKVESDEGEPLKNVNIIVVDRSRGTSSTQDGSFQLEVPPPFPLKIRFSHLDYIPHEISVDSPDAKDSLIITMKKRLREINEVKISVTQQPDHTTRKLSPNLTARLPSAGGNAIEGLVRSQMGVASDNELSNQYRVRGGNFDENLVYLNGFEIHRPQLVRSGQQEGLSIVNPDLTESVFFSSGGFGVQYGDKMSSVLDVRYKQPDSTSGSANINLLGMSVHAEGSNNNGKLTWLSGIRHKTNRYLLGTMDTKGDYNPSFRDAQVFLSYQVNPKLKVDMLGYYALNKYQFIPSDRETTFGTMSDVKRLKIYFAGQEEDRFETGMGGLKFQYNTNNGSQYDFLASHYRAFEEEGFDIAGAYWLQDIQSFEDSETATNIGVGEYVNHARNDLLATVSTFSAEGEHSISQDHSINWGLEWRSEQFSDRINEWEMNDSAGYSVPRNPEMELKYSRQADFDIRTQHFKGFITHKTNIQTNWSKIRINYGTRVIYSDREEKLHLTPRFQVALLPMDTPDTRFRISGGWYYQPPFYKEYRPPQSGKVNHVNTQKSRQILTGLDHHFSMFGRPFQFTTEAYYKYFSDLIPYQVDNVRILYSGRNEAKGFATGVDFKLHGEFVPGTESWATLSLLRTMEDLKNDTWTKSGEPGYIPRPSDQRLNFSMFFQDYLPNNPTFKVNLSLFYGTGLPFGPPRSPRYMATHRMPPYRRVDVGFSKNLLPWLNRNTGNRLIKDFWLGLEVFNLLDISNTISYYWVSDVENRQYAVPNYLTGRRINVSLNVAF